MSTPEQAPAPKRSTDPLHRPWYSRLNLLNTCFLLFLLATLYSASSIEGPSRNTDVLRNLTRFFADFFPPDLSVLPTTLEALLETVEIAVVATANAIVLSIIIALGAARNVAPRWLVRTTRLLLNGIRTIPSLIWAVIGVAALGPNPAAGVAALTFYSIGYLAKFFSEAFESVDISVARALKGIGADPIQAFQYGIWPHARPIVWSNAIWMLEYNIRSASIIGYVGAGGLGLQLHAYQEFHQWDRFATVLFTILLVVTALDLLSERIRHSLKLHPKGSNL